MQLCSPALIYLIFSAVQIIIDTFKGLYNTAAMKVIVAVVITLLLNILCERGMGIVSWLIVFIPFMFMTFIVAMLLYIFGLDVSTGKIDKTCIQKEDDNKGPEHHKKHNDPNHHHDCNNNHKY
jgi:Ca2+/H+ antiporter